jgi:hypothetical protein
MARLIYVYTALADFDLGEQLWRAFGRRLA